MIDLEKEIYFTEFKKFKILKIVLLFLLFSSILSAQKIETTLEYTSSETLGFGADVSIPLVYKGLSQLVIGSRVYTTTTSIKEMFYKRSTWNVGHRLEFKRDKHTASFGLYSGFECWPSDLDGFKYNVRPLAYLEYMFSKGYKFPKNKTGVKVFIGGSDNEFRIGTRLVFNLRKKYIAYYKN